MDELVDLGPSRLNTWSFWSLIRVITWSPVAKPASPTLISSSRMSATAYDGIRRKKRKVRATLRLRRTFT